MLSINVLLIVTVMREKGSKRI